MKKACVLLPLVLLLLLPACSSRSADLQQGWYARIDGVGFMIRDIYGEEWPVGDPYFLTPPGSYPPFTLTDEPYYDTYYRKAIVTENVYSVGPSSSLVLPLNSGVDPGTTLDAVGFYWVTNYDASQMRLEFWRNSIGGPERLWEQTLSGYKHGGQTFYDLTPDGGFFFKVAVLPEPSSVGCLAAGLSCFVFYAGRRRRR